MCPLIDKLIKKILLFFFLHSTFNSPQNSVSYTYKIYPESNHFSAEITTTSMVASTIFFFLHGCSRLLAVLPTSTIDHLQSHLSTTARVALLNTLSQIILSLCSQPSIASQLIQAHDLALLPLGPHLLLTDLQLQGTPCHFQSISYLGLLFPQPQILFH